MYRCTQLSSEQILEYFSRRWTMEVTLEESRAHLGVETQRQWSDQAIARTTPVLPGLFSVVALWADQLYKDRLVSQATYYLFRCMAAVRSSIYKQGNTHTCTPNRDMVLIPKQLWEQLTTLITRAA